LGFLAKIFSRVSRRKRIQLKQYHSLAKWSAILLSDFRRPPTVQVISLKTWEPQQINLSAISGLHSTLKLLQFPMCCIATDVVKFCAPSGSFRNQKAA
jgi:hypothetical protein